MAAPKGHPLWGNPLNPKKYTPEGIWDKFVEYKEWNDANPIMVVEQSKMPQRIPTNYKGSLKKFLSQLIYLPHPRPLSIERFCIFANITRETFDPKTPLYICASSRTINFRFEKKCCHL